LKVVALTASSEGPPTENRVAAEQARVDREIGTLRNLVKQAGIFLARSTTSKHIFLLTLSDHVAHFGWSTHESNDSRIDERR